MSECVVRMEMPLDCQYCPMAHWDIRDRLMGCEAANGKRYLQGKDDEFWENGRPSWCPIICSLPEGHGRLVDADAFEKDVSDALVYGLKEIPSEEGKQLFHVFMQEVLDNVKKRETIVPATAERSEA